MPDARGTDGRGDHQEVDADRPLPEEITQRLVGRERATSNIGKEKEDQGRPGGGGRDALDDERNPQEQPAKGGRSR